MKEVAAAQSARVESEGELQRCRSVITELQAALAAAQVRLLGLHLHCQAVMQTKCSRALAVVLGAAVWTCRQAGCCAVQVLRLSL